MGAIADELPKLAKLREAGSLSADEYLEAKAIVLSGRLPATADGGKTNYGPATAAFVLGLVGIPFAWIGIIPIAAVVVSIHAAATFDGERHKNLWMAATGLVLGALGTLAMLSHYKHI